MADNIINPLGSPTTNYGWIKPTVGGDPDVWGGYINTDLDSIDTAVFGMLPKAGGTMTGALTPSQTAGIVGTTTNNNANAGAVGEYLVSNKMTNVTLTSAIYANVTTLSLTAGDWDIEGNAYVTFTNVGTSVTVAVSTTSATPPPSTYTGSAFIIATNLTDVCLATGALRVSIAATTTVYLIAQGAFTAGTSAVQGSLRARRMR